MIIHSILKPFLLFLAGVVFTLILLQLLTNPDFLSFLGQEPSQIEGQVREEIYKREEKAAKSVTQTIIEKVLPAAAENPVVAPLLETKQEVEQTVNTIRNLPEEQKSAICRQVCNP